MTTVDSVGAPEIARSSRIPSRSLAVILVLFLFGGCSGSSDDSDERQVEPRFSTSASGTDVAPCRRAMIGRGPDDWRRSSIVAGPLAVRSRPFLLAEKVRQGEFETKLPALVVGHREVKLEVPERLRERVGLFFSPEHSLTTRGVGAAGVLFMPCSDKPRTVWPGGILVAGREPVWLRVTEKGRPPDVLWLGRVKPPPAY